MNTGLVNLYCKFIPAKSPLIHAYVCMHVCIFVDLLDPIMVVFHQPFIQSHFSPAGYTAHRHVHQHSTGRAFAWMVR